MASRYYFHGDQIEDKDEQYFCAYCDLFIDELHFEKYEHSDSNKEKYDRSVKGWKILNDNSPGYCSRPNKAINLFSHIPKPPKLKKARFIDS